MNPDSNLPLTESQQRRLTVRLATLEKQLQALREQLEHRPHDSRLLRYDDPLDAGESTRLLPAVVEVERQLRRIADDLRLEAQVEPGRRTFTAGLELAGIHLYECTVEGGLGGYGPVAPATADYLAREISKLEAAVQSLLQTLRQGGQKGSNHADGSHP